MAIHLPPICAFQKFKEHLSKLETFHVCITRENLLNMRVHDENDYLIIFDGSFVTAIGDILKISPMTVTKESLDRVHCCHSHHWHIKNWNFHEMSLMSVKKVVPTLLTFVTAIGDICCYHLRLLVPVLPDLSSLTVTKESLDRRHFCHSLDWYFCQS